MPNSIIFLTFILCLVLVEAQSPTSAPVELPSATPSLRPTSSTAPSESTSPSAFPTISVVPSSTPSVAPSSMPSVSSAPSFSPSVTPSDLPSLSPTFRPSTSSMPSVVPSQRPSTSPSVSLIPSVSPSSVPSDVPSFFPTRAPTLSAVPSATPSISPSAVPSLSLQPSSDPTVSSVPTLSIAPSTNPTTTPTVSSAPSTTPSVAPSRNPTGTPSAAPSSLPSVTPTISLTQARRDFLVMTIVGLDRVMITPEIRSWEGLVSQTVQDTWSTVPNSPVFVGGVVTRLDSQSLTQSTNSTDSRFILQITYLQQLNWGLYEGESADSIFGPMPDSIFTVPFDLNQLYFTTELAKILNVSEAIVVTGVEIRRPTPAPTPSPAPDDDKPVAVIVAVVVIVSLAILLAGAYALHKLRKDSNQAVVQQNSSDEPFNNGEPYFIETGNMEPAEPMIVPLKDKSTPVHRRTQSKQSSIRTNSDNNLDSLVPDVAPSPIDVIVDPESMEQGNIGSDDDDDDDEDTPPQMMGDFQMSIQELE